MTLYAMKPAFRRLLQPAVARLAAMGVTANQVTTVTAVLSVAIGVAVAVNADAAPMFIALAVWCGLRMALNAIDGMLAAHSRRRTALGAYLNELGDVVSDAALYVPFAFAAPFSIWSVGAVVLLAVLSELAGAIGPMVGTARQYDGPMGKSDRAAVFALLALWIAIDSPLPSAALWVMPVLGVLIAVTVLNRIRSGVRGAGPLHEPQPLMRHPEQSPARR